MNNTNLRMSNPNPWTIIGGPSPGTVAALAVGLSEGYTVFAGTRAGLYRTGEVHREAQAHWQRLPAAPLEIISLGISPNYAEDSTILAGTGRGLFVSRDGGDHWQTAHTPMPDSVVLCFCFSPNYGSDGIILAGTLEDGIYYSDTRGERWSFRGFGLLDAAVYALAISPDFARDETVFAGTESALYYSYNGARAWKPLDFPEDATRSRSGRTSAILSLALSPHFSRDQTLYVGTEHQGLYCSADLGKTWQKADLPATCVNAMIGAPEQESLFAATNAGLFCSSDGGQRWTCLFDAPDVFSVTVSDGIIIASLVNEGAWLTRDRATWHPFFSIPARSLTGMVLSPRFDIDPVAFLYGPQEGMWRTMDRGVSWSCLNERLPGLDIHSLAISPGFPQDRVLVAASTNGILMSEDAGDHWSLMVDTPATLVVCSPGGKFVAGGFPGGEIRVADAWEGRWQSVPVPWGKQGQVLALAIDDNFRLRIALLDQAKEVLSIWEGEPGHFEQILGRLVSPTPVVRFWLPPYEDSGRTWYASLDHQLWEFRRPWEKGPVSANLVFETEDGGRVLTLTGSQTPRETVLFACTGQTLYQAVGTNAWTAIHDFGDERAISLALSPAYPDDATAFALLLGGSFCRGILKRLERTDIVDTFFRQRPQP